MSDPVGARTLALALEARNRHGVTMAGTCLHCLPPGTGWPCLPFQLAAATVDQLAAGDFPPAAVHPEWLDGSAERSDPGQDG
jgi:hypothetical protein